MIRHLYMAQLYQQKWKVGVIVSMHERHQAPIWLLHQSQQGLLITSWSAIKASKP
jgi:hypothetical protein